MRWRFGLSVVAVLAIHTGSLAQGVRARPFSEVAAEAFDEWDADRNGTLSAEELDRLVVSPQFSGEHAAALAAMKLVVRSAKVTPPDLTLDFVTNHSKEPAGELLPSEQANAPDPNNPDARRPTGGRPPASLERRYQSALRKISSAKPDLFADGAPDIGSCRQGPLGSCFFVAGVGAFVDRDPEALKRMFHIETDDQGNQAYRVSFGDGQTISIPALTEAQHGLTSSAGRDGRWLAVLEQAYGALRMKSRPESRQTLESSDALARGGSLGTTLRVLTGHAIDRVRLRPIADTDPELVDRVKAILDAAAREKRLAGASTGSTTPLPPGINGKHAYAVLAYDPERGAVRMWNPHGNSFRPKGEPGIERGYETRSGIFELPVAEFVRVFDSLVVESERSAASAR